MELAYYGLSDPGIVRSNNEDYLFAGQLKTGDHLFVVADGMGGHQAGEVASRKAVSMMVHHLEKEDGFSSNAGSSAILERLKGIVMEINETLIREGQHSLKKNGMGTTFSALFIKDDRGYLVHVGDSRIYLYSGSEAIKPVAQTSPASLGDTRPEQQYSSTSLVQLTEDHSFVGKLLKDRLITREEARIHPRRNVLYQSLGIKREIDIQARGAFPLEKGHKYLLCSDGLHGVIPDPEIEYYLKGKSTVRTAEQLVQQAKSNGGPDNITVIVVSTEPDVAAGISDTVKIIAPAFKKKKSRAWFFILLILLILLLSLVIYFLLRSADTRVASLTPLEDLAEKSVTVETVVPAVLPGKG